MLMGNEIKGNLAQIRDALQVNYAEVAVGDVVGVVDVNTADPTMAELLPETTGKWHVVETEPNHERIVASHLIGRRFGVYVPEIKETIIRRGRVRDVTRLMFTRYIFVFVWDINHHWSRIVSIAGVSRIVSYASGEAAVVLDHHIDRIRAVENQRSPISFTVVDDVARPAKKKRRHRKKGVAQPLERAGTELDIVAVRPWSAFEDGIASVDDTVRNQTLLTALGLSS